MREESRHGRAELRTFALKADEAVVIHKLGVVGRHKADGRTLRGETWRDERVGEREKKKTTERKRAENARDRPRLVSLDRKRRKPFCRDKRRCRQSWKALSATKGKEGR
jgi:hypothetical protein